MSLAGLWVPLFGAWITAQSPAPSDDPLAGISMVVLEVSGREDWGRRLLTETMRETVREKVKNLIPYSRFLRAERELELKRSNRSPESIAEVGRKIGADYVLWVRISRDGWRYTAHAIVVRCTNGEVFMDLRSDYYRPLDEASDRARRISSRALQKIEDFLSEVEVEIASPDPDRGRVTVTSTGGAVAEQPPEEDWDFGARLDEQIAAENEGGTFIDSSILESVTRGLIWHGHFQTYAAMGVRGKFAEDFIVFENRLQLDLESNIGDVHIVAKPQFTFDWRFRDLVFGFREVYAARYWGPIDLQFGERILTWGITDFFPVVDIVNPRDYTSLRKWWPIDEKRPVPMVQAGFVAEPLTFEAVAVLLNRNTAFELDQEAPFAVAVVVPQFTTRLDLEVPSALEGAAVGGHIDLQISDWKLSTYALLGRNPVVSVYIDIDPDIGGARINTLNERVLMLATGIQGSLDFMDAILKAEGAYYYRVDDICAERIKAAESQGGLVGLPKCFFQRRVPSFRTTVGLERKIIPKLDAHLQFITEITPEGDLEEVPRIVSRSLPGFFKQHSFNPILTLRLQGRWFNDDFRPSIFSYISLADEDFFVNPDIEYYLGDGLAVALGGFLFEGYSKTPNKNRFTFMGAIEDSTHAYLRVTAWF